MTTEKLIAEAELSLGRGLHDAAEKSYRNALANTRDESLQAQALYGLAIVSREKKQYQQMIDCALEALRRNESFWGSQSLQSADATALAAEGYALVGEFVRAKAFYIHALEVRLMHYPPEHEQIISLQTGLLMLALAEGSTEKAIELHQILLPAYRNVVEGDNWTNFLKLDQLIERWGERNQKEEAEAIIKMELTILQEHFRKNKDELNAVLAMYRTFSKNTGRTMAEWQLGVTQSDDQRREDRITQANRQHTEAQTSQNRTDKIDVRATAKQILNELPQFLDSVATLAESGVSVNAALAQSCQLLSCSCPALAKELDKALQDWSQFNKSLTDSLVEMGKRFDVDQLEQLGLTLVIAQKTGGSVASILREQSFAIRYRLKAKEIEVASLGNHSVSPDISPLKRMAADEEYRKRKSKE
jgi:tetratricopeptide (TPR) repeat protein